MNPIIQSKFFEIFNQKPSQTIFAPGRANIIGEHTDYNNGFVLPFAIHQGIRFAFSPNDTSEFHVYAYNTNESFTFTLGDEAKNYSGWQKFFIQVLQVIDFIPQSGLNVVFGGDLPIGAGVSSSSALTCGWVTVIMLCNNKAINPELILKYAVSAERGYGVQGGIMDQFTIINALKNHAIFLDCKTHSYRNIVIPTHSFHFYLINTHVQHNLVDSEYNQRQDECQKAVKILSQKYTHIKSLREASLKDIEILKPFSILYRRAKFVISENQRVLDALNALDDTDCQSLGNILLQSHQGLRDLYEVSCEELDELVELAKSIPEIVGARMMGGGFGGCTINLTQQPLKKESIQKIKIKYKQKFGVNPDVIHIQPEQGIINSLI